MAYANGCTIPIRSSHLLSQFTHAKIGYVKYSMYVYEK